MAVDSDHDESVRRIARRMRGNIFGGTIRGDLLIVHVCNYICRLFTGLQHEQEAGRTTGNIYFTILSKSDFYFKCYFLKQTCIMPS